MNIDRQFRHKNGIFGNIIPLPSASLVAVTARKNIMKTLNSCDGLQSILQ